jgi:thiamine-phosphate pyrophosphorylase
VSLPPQTRELKLCYVTDRKTLAGSAEDQKRLLLEKIDCAACAGVDWIQIREKDLSGRELMSLICEAVKRVPSHCRILVNDRLDVAIAADAAGVHLGEQSIPAAQAKRLANERKGAREFLVGVSAHSLQSVREAEQNGADYVIFGPVFATPSKIGFGEPQGLKKLEYACRSVSVPVMAIGGITLENARECAAAGAAGIAAIRLFREAGDLRTVVQALRGPLK